MWSMKHVRGHSALDDYVVSVADKVSTCNIVQSIWSYFYNSWDFITICYILGLVKNYLLPLNVISTEELLKNGFLGFLFLLLKVYLTLTVLKYRIVPNS